MNIANTMVNGLSRTYVTWRKCDIGYKCYVQFIFTSVVEELQSSFIDLIQFLKILRVEKKGFILILAEIY